MAFWTEYEPNWVIDQMDQASLFEAHSNDGVNGISLLFRNSEYKPEFIYREVDF